MYSDKVERFKEYYDRIKISDGPISAKIGMAYYILDGVTHHNTSYYMRFIDRRLEHQIKPFENNFHYDPQLFNQKVDFDNRMPIWVCWFQGYSEMPELVKMCYKQLLSMVDETCVVILLTKDNIEQYISFPESVKSKIGKGYSLTNFSDLLRFSLIAQYGGLWIDSTVYVSQKINRNIIQNGFFSQKDSESEDAKYYASKHLWSSWLLGDKAGSLLFSYVSQAMEYYYENFQGPIDYYLCDYLFRNAINHFDEVRNSIGRLPDNNTGTFRLFDILNEEYNPGVLDDILSSNQFSKLSFKRKSVEEINGKRTNYSVLLKSVGDNI